MSENSNAGDTHGDTIRNSSGNDDNSSKQLLPQQQQKQGHQVRQEDQLPSSSSSTAPSSSAAFSSQFVKTKVDRSPNSHFKLPIVSTAFNSYEPISTIRETTPPQSFRYPSAPSSPATPNATHFDEMYKNGDHTMTPNDDMKLDNSSLIPPADPPLTPAHNKLSTSRFLDSIMDQYLQCTDDDRIAIVQALLGVSSRAVLSEVNRYISPLLKKDPFTILPNEISLRIISFIDDPQTLARASQVSRLWYLLLSDDLTWKELCKSHHYRRLSAAVSLAPNRSHSIGSDSLAGFLAAGGGMEDLAEAIYNPDVTKGPIPTSYRSHFKHQYMLNTAWNSGGRLAAKYVISNSGVVTSLLMTGGYIVFALDNSKIFVFREDGKLLRSLFGHVMGVWALTLWGDTLVSGGCDRDVRVWNLKTGECLQILRGHSSTVRCLQMANPTTAISGSRDNTIRIWDITRGTCRAVLQGHRSSVRCIEVKGDICVSGSYDFTAKVWRISDGTLLHTLNGHFSQIYSLAFDGKRIATGSLDASIRIWDVETGACLSVLQGHTSLVGQLQMKDDILVSGGSDGALRVWDLKEYKCVHRLAAHDNSVTSLQFDENRIVSGGSDGKVRVWDLQTGLHIRDLSSPFDSVWRVAFKDEKVAILASRNNRIHMELTSFSPPREILDTISQSPVIGPVRSNFRIDGNSTKRVLDPLAAASTSQEDDDDYDDDDDDNDDDDDDDDVDGIYESAELADSTDPRVLSNGSGNGAIDPMDTT